MCRFFLPLFYDGRLPLPECVDMPFERTPVVPAFDVVTPLGRSLPSMTALRCFDASARWSSFTRAAQEVYLTQSAVSHQILKLEEELGVQLFERKRSGLQLTQAGAAYWREVSAALLQLERATHNLRMHGVQAGMLNLSTASSFGTYWLMPRLAGFLAQHPEVTLNISMHVGRVDFAVQHHDAAIEYCMGQEEGVQACKVANVVLQPYAAPSCVERHLTKGLPQLLQLVPLIHQTTVMEAWPGWLAQAGLAEQVGPLHQLKGARYDLLSMGLNGAIAGLGVALLPAYMAEAAVQNGQLQCLSEVRWQAEKAYYLRFPAWKAEQPALRKFMQWLLRER